MEVYVVRHTEVAVEKGYCYGQSDVSLTDNFLQQITQVKAKLPTDLDQVFSSPLSRCGILAEHISDTAVVYNNDLMEMDFGIWENKTWDSIDSEHLQKWMDDFVFTKAPNGESLELLYQRVVSFIEELRQQRYNKVALVTHAGVIRCLWAFILNIPLEKIFRIPVQYGEGFVFKLAETQVLDQIVQTKI